MKSISHLVFIMLTVVALSACAEAIPQSGDEMVEPGDKIGDFLITTSNDDSVIYTTTIHCPFDSSTMTETCEIETGKKVNVGLGVFGKSVEELDTYWAGQTYQMTIEGRLVNLQAFGSIEITHPIAGQMRLWNIVIITDNPGNITIQHSGEMAGESMEGTNVLIFVSPKEIAFRITPQPSVHLTLGILRSFQTFPYASVFFWLGGLTLRSPAHLRSLWLSN